MEVSKPKFELKGAIDALTHARVLIHSSSTAEVDKVIGPGLEVSAKGYEAGTAALAERSSDARGWLSLWSSFFFGGTGLSKTQADRGPSGGGAVARRVASLGGAHKSEANSDSQAESIRL